MQTPGFVYSGMF